MAVKKGPMGLSLNLQHDYITLKTPNGNYSAKLKTHGREKNQ